MKKLLAMLLVLSMALACVGCAQEAAPAETADAPAQEAQADAKSGEKKTVRIFQFKVEIADQLQALAEEYMELHPEIDLQVESVSSDDYDTLLKSKFASGEAPDIFNNEGFGELNLWLEKLEDLSDQPWVADMGSTTIDGCSDENGAIYGLPLYIEGVGLCYNTKLFEKAGITEIPTTLEGLEAACQKLEAANIPCFVVSAADWYNPGVFVANVAMAHQPDVDAFIDAINAGTTTFQDNAEFNQLVDFIDLMKKYPHLDPMTTTFSDQMSRIANEEAAMTVTVNGCWLSFMELNPEVEVDFMPIPINNDPVYNDVLYAGPSTYWVVNKESEVKEEAKEFLNWLVSSERGRHYLSEEFAFVCGLTSIPVADEFVGPLGVATANAVANDKALGLEWSKYPDGMTVEFGTWIQKYIADQCTKEEMLEGFTNSWLSLAE